MSTYIDEISLQWKVEVDWTEAFLKEADPNLISVEGDRINVRLGNGHAQYQITEHLPDGIVKSVLVFGVLFEAKETAS